MSSPSFKVGSFFLLKNIKAADKNLSEDLKEKKNIFNLCHDTEIFYFSSLLFYNKYFTISCLAV